MARLSTALLFLVFATLTLADEIDKLRDVDELNSLINKDEVEEILALDAEQLPEFHTRTGGKDFVTRVRRTGDVKLARVKLDEFTLTELDERVKILEDWNLDAIKSTISTVMQETVAKSSYVSDWVDVKERLTASVNNSIEEMNAAMMSQVLPALRDLDDALALLSTETVDNELNDKGVLDSVKDEAVASIEKSSASIQKSLADFEVDKVFGTVDPRLKTTYLKSSQIPVYRFHEWSDYQGHLSGSPSSYGGVAWSKDQVHAADFPDDFSYLRQLFIQKGVATTSGAMVYSQIYIWPKNNYQDSNFFARSCGAVFRIKNKGSTSITWRPRFTLTGQQSRRPFEPASVSVNGARTWASTCNSYCARQQVSLTLPANKISTIVVISRSNYGSEYSPGRIRGMLLHMEELNLPTGLEYVDDLDNLEGKWKQ